MIAAIWGGASGADVAKIAVLRTELKCDCVLVRKTAILPGQARILAASSEFESIR